MSGKTYQITPIGTIHAAEGGCYLEIARAYRAALRGLDGFSHLQVLWWCHLCDDPELRKIVEWDQPYRQGPRTLGIFATRSPLRPNLIALTAVAVTRLDPDDGRIDIPYIDAEDGTPILDIKPYHPSVDRVRDVAVPAWRSSSRAGACPRHSADHLRVRELGENMKVGNRVGYPYWLAPRDIRLPYRIPQGDEPHQ